MEIPIHGRKNTVFTIHDFILVQTTVSKGAKKVSFKFSNPSKN